MLTFLSVVVAAIIFEYSNGFHDAANAIATVVSTKVLTPGQAVAMAAFVILTGALLGGAVASTIGKGSRSGCCCVRVEHHHMVVRFAFELESRAHWRTLRSSACDGARRLVGHKVERRRMAESCCAHDHLASRWIYFWRATDVFAFPNASSFHAAFCQHAIWQAANL